MTPVLAASFVVFLVSAGMAVAATSTAEDLTQAINQLNADIAKKKADAAALKSQMAAYQKADRKSVV